MKVGEACIFLQDAGSAHSAGPKAIKAGGE